MDERQANLRSQLESFVIGPAGSSLTFERRLARENGWPGPYAARVAAEYKRFIFLMAEAGHPVTPSEQVDQAWHLHMVYTRSYWTDLCERIVGRPLHHTPTEGGSSEERKFEQWYIRTLDTYRQFFGQEPPADIWPPVEVRFGTPPARWVSTGDHWIVPKPRAKRWGTIAACVASAVALGGCSLLLGNGGDEVVITVVLIVALTIAVAAAFINRRSGSGSGCGGGGGCGATGCGSSSSGCNGGDSSGCSSGCSSSGCGSSGCGGGGCGGGGD